MGFWSGLGKILGAAAPIAAAPFTGGASLAVGGGLGLLGKTFSGGAKGMEDSRALANQQILSQDRLRSDDAQNFERALEDRAKLDMDQREQSMKTQQGGYRDALRAQYLQGWQPAQRPSRIPMVTGGFNTIPQSARDLAKQYEQEMTLKALQGEKFDALPAIERFKPTPMKEPSLWEKMSGALGLGLQGAGAIAKGMRDDDGSSGGY